MDRGRSFSILGLSENATKAQVEAAYQRKVARYKGPDYAEEPAYAERKLSQLYQAYQEALELAESNPAAYQNTYTTRDVGRPAETKKKPAKASRLLDEERDAAEHNLREKFHQWMERRDDEKNKRKDSKSKSIPKLAKPDFSKLKDKLKEMKDEVATQLDLNTEEDVESTNVEAFEVEGDPERYVPSKQDSKNDEKIGTIVSLVVALVIFLIGSCGDSDVEEDYEEPAYSYIYDQSIEDIEESDREVAELADRTYVLLTEQTERGSAYLEDDRESYYRDKADLFAQKYWDKDSISLVSDYLYQNYGDYAVSSDDPASTQLEAIFAFYGFASLETAQWYDQPYTGERIESYGNYLDYLNQFYEAQ
ncbi:MAG: hypothetical protein IKJ77_02345 [Firmicutes bacterium]|nr:hypothetical protein [Bacillota bacterium]